MLRRRNLSAGRLLQRQKKTKEEEDAEEAMLEEEGAEVAAAVEDEELCACLWRAHALRSAPISLRSISHSSSSS